MDVDLVGKNVLFQMKPERATLIYLYLKYDQSADVAPTHKSKTAMRLLLKPKNKERNFAFPADQ
jgi:hypothetical protein